MLYFSKNNPSHSPEEEAGLGTGTVWQGKEKVTG